MSNAGVQVKPTWSLQSLPNCKVVSGASVSQLATKAFEVVIADLVNASKQTGAPVPWQIHKLAGTITLTRLIV